MYNKVLYYYYHLSINKEIVVVNQTTLQNLLYNNIIQLMVLHIINMAIMRIVNNHTMQTMQTMHMLNKNMIILLDNNNNMKINKMMLLVNLVSVKIFFEFNSIIT